MGDDETRREDAREEAHIDRALRNGTMGKCYLCGDPTSNKEFMDEDFVGWLCRPCARMMDEPGD